MADDIADRTDGTIETDVVIVGAGPAGAAAAMTLARAGLRATILDKAIFPRDKFCGDGLTVWTLRQLDEMGLDPATVPSWRVVKQAVLISPSGREVLLPLPERGTFCAVARRSELDAAVLDIAREAGAEVLTGQECTSLAQGDDRVRVATSTGMTVVGRYLIAADGMWSTVRKLTGTGIEGYRGEWHAFRQYFEGVTGRAQDEMLAWFEPDFLPGYAWSFPVGNNEANVGFGIMRGGSWRVGAMRELWAEISSRPHIRAALGPGAAPEGPPRAWPIPARVGEVPLSCGRVLFTGDAAAAADPLTGEGIGQAYATGRWAADAIIRCGASVGEPMVADRYESSVRSSLFRDHQMSALLNRALSHRKGARTAIWLVSLSPWTRRNFARWLFEDYPRAMLATPRRWHHGMFSGPGAFGP